MKAWFGLCVLVVLGCKRESEHAPPARASTAPADAPLASAAPRSASPKASSHAPPHAVVALEQLTRARALVSAWDTALNRHDVAALAPLYAENVSFYGRATPRDELMRAKQRALTATPDYAQALSNLTLSRDADGSVKVNFTKRSGARNAQREVDASLRLQRSKDGFLIASESDAPSDARSDRDKTCMEVALEAAYALPEVARAFKDAPADARPGGVTYTEEPTSGSAALGFHHDDHFEAVFSVDVDAGKLNASQYGEALPVPSAVQARVRAKCAPRAGL